MALGLLALAAPAPVVAQAGSLAAGYTSMPGRIGARGSDRGLALLVGLDLKTGRHLAWSLEGGVDRLNEDVRTWSDNCMYPGGGLGTCHGETRDRDTGVSLSTALRVHLLEGGTRPYAVVGLGYLQVRNRHIDLVTDDAGNRLENFSGNALRRDDAIRTSLGFGVVTRPSELPVGLFVEGRLSRVFYGYSGGVFGDWNPAVFVGVRTGSR